MKQQSFFIDLHFIHLCRKLRYNDAVNDLFDPYDPSSSAGFKLLTEEPSSRCAPGEQKALPAAMHTLKDPFPLSERDHIENQ